MAKAVGGLLGFLNLIGEKLIYALIGEDASNDTNMLNYLRPFLGGTLLGSIFGILLSFIGGWLWFFVVPFLFGTVGLALEELRKMTKR